jgi:integrase/recombinase XerD
LSDIRVRSSRAAASSIAGYQPPVEATQPVRCWQLDRRLFDVRRIDIEYFARDLEDRGKARATVARRLLSLRRGGRGNRVSPAVHIRRPRIADASHVAHLDRNELGAILVATGFLR